MNNTMYFKTSAPAVIESFLAYEKARAELVAAGKAFAERFDGEAYFLTASYGVRFGGLKFNPKKASIHWTQPDDFGGQRPRASIAKSSKQERAEHAALLFQWSENIPKQQASTRPFLESLGTDWGITIFGGISWFKRDSFIYVGTPLLLGPHVIEILGSEFKAAQAKSV